MGIFFNETFRKSYWYLLEQIRILKYGVGAIWKKHIFSTGPHISNRHRHDDQDDDDGDDEIAIFSIFWINFSE